MSYAVIRTGGKQYRVAPGDVVRIERLSGDVGSAVEFGEVLIAADDAGIRVGRPLVEGARVLGQIVVEADAKLSERRVWLQGSASGRYALLQEYVARPVDARTLRHIDHRELLPGRAASVIPIATVRLPGPCVSRA